VKGKKEKSVVIALAVFISVTAVAQDRGAGLSFCKPAAKPQFLANVPEASGVALSNRDGTMLWTLNDSGEPQLFGFDPSGKSAHVAVTGAELRDWEDLALAKCGGLAKARGNQASDGGDCLYIADIGDNNASRKRITVYRVPEPAVLSTATAAAEPFHAIYPDGPHDAEAFFVTPQDQWFIVTKEIPPRLYQFPVPPKPGTTVTLQLVRSINERIRITGAAASPDGRWVALRSNGSLLIYRTDDLVGGRDPIRIDLTSLKEPQGEGIAFGRGDQLYLVSETGNAKGGLVLQLNCALPK
jgi:hypothetical protein